MSTPKKNTAYVLYMAVVDSAAGGFRVNPTIAAGDFKVSIDDGALGNLATLPVVTPAGSRIIKVSLSTAEMNGDKVVVQAVDVAGNEWEDQLVFLDLDVINLDEVVRSTTPANTLDVSATGEADANVVKLGGSATALATLAALYDGAVVRGTVAAVSGNDDFTLTSTDLSSNNNDYNTMWLVMLTGSSKFIPRLIGSYTGVTKRVLFSGTGLAGGFPQAINVGDEWMILSGSL